MPDLKTKLAGINLENPLILASGFLGVSKASLEFVIKNGAGAVTIKSISRLPRSGHHAPIIAAFEAGLLNAVGYSNPGMIKAREEYADLKKLKAPVFLSAIGQKPGDFAKVVATLEKNDFAAVEIVLSCPHTPGYGTLAGQSTPAATAKITKAVRKVTRKPLFVKVSPDAPKLTEICKAAEAAGADGITAVNTMGPGMIIDLEARKPVLGFGMGGVSGAALHPIAVRCVYEISQAVKIPIIGTGGVTSGRDAIEMVMAGATGIGVGTAISTRGVACFHLIAKEMQDWMKENGVKSLEEIRGIAWKMSKKGS